VSEESPPQLAGFLAGSLLAGYRLEAQVGAGGMAVVFRARDERLGRLVALKILAPGLADDSEFRQRFIAESRAAAAVDDPHIIPVYEAGEANGALFIAMRFVQGGDLRQVLLREGALAPDRAAGFISPVASALDAAHRAGLVHRDVKPANVLVDAREDRPDHVYLSDFGVSKRAMSQAGLTAVGVFLGTPDYSAPEQIEGQPVDGRTDQYALACVSYQLLTGTVPFERDQGMAVLLAHLSKPPPSAVERRPELPGAVDQVLAKGMAKVPEERYESCSDFADALREALGLTPYHRRGPVTAPPRPPLPATPPSSPSEAPSPVAAAIVAAGQAAAVGSDPGFAAASDPRSAVVDSLPGGGSVGVAEVPAPIVVTGPRSQGRGAEDDAGTGGPRWRRLHRKRRGPSSAAAAAVTAEDLPAATTPATAESPPAEDLQAAAEPASPQLPVASPTEIPPPAAAAANVAAAIAGLGTPADVAAAVESDLGTPADVAAAVESDLGTPADVAAAIETDLGTSADVAAAIGSNLGTPADVAVAVKSDRRTGDFESVPTAALVAGKDLPAPTVPATAESPPTGDLETAGEPAPPQLPIASPTGIPSPPLPVAWPVEIPPLTAVATPTAVTPAHAPDVTSDPALSGAMEGAPGGGPASTADVTAAAFVTGPGTGPGRVGRETDGDARTAAPTAGRDGLTDPGSGTDVMAPAGDRQLSAGDRPGTIAALIRRHRLPVFALVCAIVAAAAALPFVLTSPAHSPSRGNPPSRGNSSRSASSPLYNRVGIDLPAGYRGLVSSLAFSPSGATLAIAAYGVCLWDIAATDCVPGPRLTTAYSVAFSPDGNILACGDDNNGSTYLWNVAAKRLLVATLPDPASEGVDSVAFSPDGKTLATGDANGSTYLWNVATEKMIGALTDSPSKGVDSVAFSPDGKTLATGDANGSTYLWNVAGRNRTATLSDSGGKGVESVAFSPDGKTLAAGDANGTTYLWNVATGHPITTLPDSGSKGVESVAFSPDGKTLAAGDADGSTYLWNVATGKPVTTLADPGSTGVNSVAFSPDGTTLATADQNDSGSVYLWHIS
jgi:serine/threonine protein kinase/sugar lactone lactonase YvrE